jgi:hypothetical protein
MKLQENGKSYYLMKGRQYMDRIIALLRCYYKSLEIALEDRPDLPTITKSGTVSSTGINVMSTSRYANGQESHSPVEPPREPTQLSVMATVANAFAAGQSASQPTGQSQGGGQSKKPNPQNSNGKPKPKFQFAPNIGTGQITYQPKVRGPRWACHVKGHSGHTIAQCQDFWGAENCIERRKLMAGTGCYTCLGRDQGCGAGACAIVKEVPKDTICQECAGYASRTGTPPNILCCGLPFHKKPVVKDAMEVMERWIPDFKASSLGVQVGVNWFQVSHSLVSNTEAEWKDDNAGKSLVYNTQTGKTRALNITDRVVSTQSQCACYVMQQLNITGRRVLAFYDSGANSNIVEYDLARDAGFHQIGFQTVSFNVAGGGSVRSSYRQFSAILGPDVNGNIHDIECQAVDQITGTFPTFRLDDIITEAKATIGSHHVFPQEIGGAPVKLLIGIRSTQLAPVLKFTLPSGLCVYESKFRDVYGATLYFGGPHEVFTRAHRQAGFRVTLGMLQVLFTESATAYIRAVVGASIEEKEAAGSPSAPPTVAPQPAFVGPAGDETAEKAPESPSSVPPAEETVQLRTVDSAATNNSIGDPSSVSLHVATAEPEPGTNATPEETPPRPTAPDPCVPLSVCVDEAPPLDASGVPPDDVRQPSAVDDPPGPTTLVETPERDMLLMAAPSAPDCLPTPPEPSTGMDDQKTTPMEELAQGFTAVTLVMVDKPPDQPLERPKTPRAFADKDRECYYVTTDYGSSDDKRNRAKPPDHEMPREAQHNSAAAFVAPPLTCDEESLCTKSRQKMNETFVQTISTGVPG